MSNALQLLFLLSLPLMFGAGIMYYSSLFELHRSLEAHHPETIALVRSEKPLPMSKFQVAYQVLRDTKAGAFRGSALSLETVRISSSANRLLHVAVFAFMTLLFSGLASEWLS